MNILFVTIAWPSEGNENLYSNLIDKFKEHGHEIFVACSAQKREGISTQIKEENGINVLRIRTGNLSKTGHIEKAVSLILIKRQFEKAIKRYYSNKEFDLILFNTPPITMSGLLKKLKITYSSSVYLLLKDIWPYGFADLGVMKRGGLAWKFFRYHEKRIYRIADYIGCMSQKGVEFILENNPDLVKNKVEVCPNTTTLPNRHYNTDESFRKKYGIPENATIFLFSGNIGKGHGVDFLIQAISKLSTYEEAFFLIGGAGTHFERINKAVGEGRSDNAFVYSYLPESEFKNLLSICDVGLILLSSDYTYPQFPSRLLAYLKTSMAVLCAVNKETDIGSIVVSNDAGVEVEHGDLKGFIKAVKKFSNHKEETKKMGKNALKLLQENYTTEHSYQIIMAHFKE
jgi:glycosyltransferase involved in cell wall biosynthesis